MLFVVVFPLIVYTVFHIDNIYDVPTKNADFPFFLVFDLGNVDLCVATFYFFKAFCIKLLKPIFTSKQITESIDSIVSIIRILVVVSSQ